jgi:Holliday junction resolvase RusA-like endonuclease
MIAFELHGDPQGWQRTGIRIAYKNGKPFPIVYTPAETRAYERALALAAKVQMGSRPLLVGPIAIAITAFMKVPASWSTKKRDQALAGVLRPVVKPDWDNVAKNIDALKDIIWNDDAHVVEAHVYKFYAENPRLRIEVKVLEPQLIAGTDSEVVMDQVRDSV